MKKSAIQISGKMRAWIILSAIIALVLLALVFFTCTNTGRLIRKVGIPYRVEWSCEPEGFGHTLYVCQTKQGMAACSLKNPSSRADGAAVASVDRGTELQLMRSYADNGTPKTESLYLFLVTDSHFEATGVKSFDYKGATHYTIQPAGDALVILCITETDKYSSDELWQIGMDAYHA